MKAFYRWLWDHDYLFFPSYWWSYIQFAVRGNLCWYFGHRPRYIWCTTTYTFIGNAPVDESRFKERACTIALCWWCDEKLWEKEGIV